MYKSLLSKQTESALSDSSENIHQNVGAIMSEDKQTLQSEIEILKKELSTWKNEAYEMSKELGEYRDKEQEREEKIGSLKEQLVEGIFAFFVGVGLSLIIIGFFILSLLFYIPAIIYKSIKYIVLETDIAKESLMSSLREIAHSINICFLFGIVKFKDEEKDHALGRGLSAGVSFVFWYILIKYCDLPIMMLS